jgi:hypothetical protein
MKTNKILFLIAICSIALTSCAKYASPYDAAHRSYKKCRSVR